MSRTKKPKIDGAAALTLRNKLGINQSEFWSRVGVTQSGGCRYEQGRPMPRPVRKLYYLTYVTSLLPGVLALSELKEYDAL